jgi:hypothetical protein
MTLYFAFAYFNYYPTGGMNDCIGVFTSYEVALDKLAKVRGDIKEIAVFDTDNMKHYIERI